MEMLVCIQDITQAYIQSTYKLKRRIFARPLKEMLNKLPEGTIFEVIRPLYSILEAGNSWFATYYKHHLNKLLMEMLSFNPCLMLTKADRDSFRIVGM